MSRFVKIVIAASVLLNLLLGGYIIGTAGRCFMGAHRYTVREMASMLPAAQRDRFQDVMLHAEQGTGDLRQKLSDARKKAAAILKADRFDRKAYLAQMQEIRQLHIQIMQHMVEAIAQLAEQSPQDERARLADILRHPPRPSNED